MRQRIPSSSQPQTPTSPEEIFGRIVRQRRMELGLKQIDLEFEHHMDRSYISKIELGKRQICLRGILHLVLILQLDINEVIATIFNEIGNTPEHLWPE